MRNWFWIAPLILLAACSRSGNQTAQSTAATSPEPVAATPPPVGYAAGSGRTATPASAPTSAPVESADRMAPTTTPAAFVIPRGTPIHARLDETVDTRRNRAGDGVSATLMEPVVVEGRTVIPAGTRFAGHVTVSDASGRFKGRAHIGVALDSFQLNGRQYRAATSSVERASGNHKKRDGLLIGGGAGLGAALGAIAGGGRGALIGAGAGAAAGTAGEALTGKLNVTIPAETPLRFTLRSAVEM